MQVLRTEALTDPGVVVYLSFIRLWRKAVWEVVVKGGPEGRGKDSITFVTGAISIAHHLGLPWEIPADIFFFFLVHENWVFESVYQEVFFFPLETGFFSFIKSMETGNWIHFPSYFGHSKIGAKSLVYLQ